jgi:hypothetical protein
MCSAPRSNINKNIIEMRLKSRNYNWYRSPKPRDVYLETQLFSPLNRFRLFSRTDEQYFVDAVSIKPVIFVENTAAASKPFLGDRWLRGFSRLISANLVRQQ